MAAETLNPHHTQPVYWDPEALRRETQRVFEICQGCRRCWNLCPSFGDLFKKIDQLEDELNPAVPAGARPPAGTYGHHAAVDPTLAQAKDPLEALTDSDRDRVVDECYQCKLCFNHCPYHPPHRFQLDFPRLMQRAKAARLRQGRGDWRDRVLAEVDLLGALACFAAPIINWLHERPWWRAVMRWTLGIHPARNLPRFHRRTFRRWFRRRPVKPAGRKVVFFYTCSVNFNEPRAGRAAVTVLEKNGFAVECPPQSCCGMPHLDGGDIERAKRLARRNVESLLPHAREGTPILALGPTCSYMLKEEYPALLQSDEARLVASRTFDVSEFLVQLKKEGELNVELRALDGTIAYQAACHLKAQNIGLKAKELLELIPGARVTVVDRCSAHDGTWSMKDEYYGLSMAYAKKLFAEIEAAAPKDVATDCPLAGLQIAQGTGRRPAHPVELLARSYGIEPEPD